MLDLASVRLFVLAAELGNLSRAAEAAGTVQPVVSQRLRSLETALGHRLLERTPRFVRLTERGAAFLPKAKALLGAHADATAFADESPVRFAFGASDHAIGRGLRSVIAQVRAALPPSALIEVRLGMSVPLREAFADGVLDAVVVRREAGSADGETLGLDPLGWRAAPDFDPAGSVLPLATLGEPCGVRSAAIRQLDEASKPWREVFKGGSCGAVMAAVHSGLGVAPMGVVASEGLPDCGPRLGLPALPSSEIALFARTPTPQVGAGVRALAAATRGALTAN